MKCVLTSVQIIYEDNRISSRYRLLDDAGNEISRGVRDTTLSQAAKDAVMAETQAEMDADIAALAPAPDATPLSVQRALGRVGDAKTQLAAVQAQIAAKQAELAAAQAKVDAANATAAKAGP